MRFIALAASLPVAFAFWNPDLCNGIGGCIGVGSFVPDPFRCPDGTGLTVSGFANDQEAAGKPGAPTVSKADFPNTCLHGNVPGPTAKFVVSFLDFLYFFLFSKLYPYVVLLASLNPLSNQDIHIQRTKTRNGQTIYSYVVETCPDAKPEVPEDCYHYNTNPAT